MAETAAARASGSSHDYSQEGRQLVASLVRDGRTRGAYNAMDVLWRHPNGAEILVGNEEAARGPAEALTARQITHIVNCTDDMPNFLEGAGCGNAWRETLLTSARNPIIPRTSAVF